MVEEYLDYIVLGGGISIFLLLLIMCLNLGIVAHRIKKLNNEFTQILKEINSYIDHVVESEEMLQKEEKKKQIKQKKESENRIINAVLEEIF